MHALFIASRLFHSFAHTAQRALLVSFTHFQVLMAQEVEAKESFEQLEMLKRTHDKLRTRAEDFEYVNDKLFGELEIVKKTLMVRQERGVIHASRYQLSVSCRSRAWTHVGR